VRLPSGSLQRICSAAFSLLARNASIIIGICHSRGAIRGGKKSQDFEHHTLALVCSKDKLSVGRALDDDEFLGVRSFLEMCSQARKPWAGTTRIVAGHDIELANLELFRRTLWCCPQQDQAIDLPWLCDGGVGGGAASQTAANRKDSLRASVAQIMDAGKDVEVERSGEDVLLAPASRLAITADVDGQNTKSGLCQFLRLLCPTLLVEPTSMSQHDATVSHSVQVTIDETSVLGRKVDTLRRSGGLLLVWTVTSAE